MHTNIYGYHIYLVVPAPTVSVGVIGSEMVGSSVSLECNVTSVKGIKGGVDIIWIKDDTEVLRENDVVGYPVNNTGLSIYRSLYNITMLQTIDDDTTYHCQAVINTSSLVNNSDNCTLNMIGEHILLLYVVQLYAL